MNQEAMFTAYTNRYDPYGRPRTEWLARSEDPVTSHQAAASVIPKIGTHRRLVYDTYAQHGPMTDERLVDLLSGRISPSSARTRRAELVRAGLLRDTGTTASTASGQQATVWEVTR